MNTAQPAPSVLSALDQALATFKEKNANPLASSPLFPYRERIGLLVAEGATASQLAELFSKAGVDVSATTVARFIRDAKLKRKGRGTRRASASKS